MYTVRKSLKKNFGPKRIIRVYKKMEKCCLTNYQKKGGKFNHAVTPALKHEFLLYAVSIKTIAFLTVIHKNSWS
jgi:hypothetical protein